MSMEVTAGWRHRVAVAASVLALGGLGGAVAGCGDDNDEGTLEDASEEVQEAGEAAGDAAEEATDEAADEADQAGDEAEQEANEADKEAGGYGS